MPLPDDAPEKWEYQKHTEIKHIVFGKYLTGWIRIVGSSWRKICYFDCFAGRGEYSDGTPGSPIRALDIATRLENNYDKFVCTFIEKNENNFNNLESIIERKKGSNEISPKIKVILLNDEFANIASGIINEVGSKLAPSFFFIDPFGMKGIPFELIKRLLSIERVEVFLTFMSRDINRFLESAKHEDVMDELFGTEEWRDIVSKYSGDARQYALRDLYIAQLRDDAGCKHVWPYEVGMDKIHQTVYHLIHATNHFKGFKLMKDIQFNANIVEGSFGYRGPDEAQTMLFKAGDDLHPIKDILLKHFTGQTKTFYRLMGETYHLTPLIEKHYREALKDLEKEGAVTIVRVPEFDKRNKPRTAVDNKCRVTFH